MLPIFIACFKTENYNWIVRCRERMKIHTYIPGMGILKCIAIHFWGDIGKCEIPMDRQAIDYV